MTITDPRTESAPAFLKPVAGLLNDPRDVAIVWLTLQCLVVAAIGVTLFFVRVPWLYAAPVYWLVLFVGLIDRFTLMLHCTSHRPLFKKQYRALNHVIPWVVGPFFGQSPGAYFSHHLGMHHREENLEADLSSTMRFRRDRFDHWLRYFFRFLFIGLFELEVYFYRRKNWKLFRRVLIGEGGFWVAAALLCLWQPVATLVVFVVPLLVMRTLMMMGNWAQHSFVVADSPENPYHASITCLNTRYNRRCFNDGYHVLHHVKPACHWTQHPVEFERALGDYAKNDSLVFDGIDFFEVWLSLMLRRWSHIADHVVALEGAPRRTREQVIQMLKERVQPIARPVAVPESSTTAEA